MENRAILLILFLIGSVVPLIANVAIFSMIVRKRQLHRVRFYIIGNLSLADVITLFISFFVTVRSLQDDGKLEKNLNSFSAVIFTTLGYGATMNSVLSTALLAIDRYIAVKYTLRYQTILTERKMILLLVILWVISLIIPGETSVIASSRDEYQHISAIIFINIRLTVSVLLLSLSKYTHHVRKRHMNNIRKRRIYFGVEKEQLDRLKKIKKSLKDSFRFYISTVVIMVAFIALGTTELISCEFHFLVKLLFVVLSQVTDFLIVLLAHQEIREQLRRLLIQFLIRNNITHPQKHCSPSQQFSIFCFAK